jgi:N-acetylmuramoyl-L-alanine amidase
MLLFIVLLGGCFDNNTLPSNYEKPVKVGFWIHNLNAPKTFIELPPSMYVARKIDNNIAVEAKGCEPYLGTPETVLVLKPVPEFWLASLIWAESRGEPLQGQAAVGQVIINRVKDPRFNNSIIDVIFESSYSQTKTYWQFSCVVDGQLFQAWQSLDFPNFITLSHSLLSGLMLDNDLNLALGFFNPTKVQSYDPLKKNWVWQQPIIKQIANHAFFTIP